MKRFAAIVALSFVFAPGILAGSREKELERFQGKWSVQRMEENGVAEPEEEIKRFALTFKGESITVDMNGRQETTKFRIEVDATPAQIDLMPQYGDDKGKTFRGIYEFDGETLRICATPRGERPKKIVSEDGTMVLILKRAKD